LAKSSFTARARGGSEEGIPAHDRSEPLASEDVRRETELTGPRADGDNFKENLLNDSKLNNGGVTN